MQYNYEVLTPDRFQELCQALVTHSFPAAISFPVGKRDGGRDAQATGPGGEVIVFQVKFRRTLEDAEDAAKLAIAAFKSELPNIKRLQQRGATSYVLITNLSATAGLDTGQRDRVDAYLKAESPIPAIVWWREEIDSRLNDAYDVKWSFSEVITSSDLLRKLIEEGFGESATRRELAIVAYLTSQCTYDESVKFKQADLQASDLLTLFIDVPASPQSSPGAKRDPETQTLMHEASTELAAPNPNDNLSRSRPDDRFVMGAASLLLSSVGQRGLDGVVVEGGPGQGKSTLAQYVCQVHRIKILGKDEKLARLPADHRLAPVRVPFKVDLRDLENWLRRIDPFNGGSPLSLDTTPSLESFLAAQVKHLSGGQNFSVDDIRLFLRRVPALIVLDGLDEVAAMSDRRDVIEAINGARSRLGATGASVQMLVTSRPAATASTPLLSGDEWHFLSLRSITEELIFDYTDRWGAARRLDVLDIAELREILTLKLSSPHIMDLSRNAMQLTILLQLIHSRGSALPDQRTQLYDRYVDILFNREADKNRVVRVHRQVLIDLHGYVAWRMHGAAQSKRANGRVSEDELRTMISTYLGSRGHDNAVLDDLFSGVVQRVVALVSRVQGTFEFEVQPLREYFAGRHLYDTAPSSPVGNPQSGTKLEIFEALARQPYWLNVTRFYAGCYSIGELAGLAGQVEDLIDDPRSGRTSFARVVASSLLGDRVFQQSPKITASVAGKAAEALTIRYAFGRLLAPSEGPILAMPSDCGRNEFLRMVADRALRHESGPIRFEASLIAQESFPQDALVKFWMDSRPGVAATGAELERWVAAGNRLGTTVYLVPRDAGALAGRSENLRMLLAEGGCPVILKDPEVQRRLVANRLDGSRVAIQAEGALGWALMALDPRFLGWRFEQRRGSMFERRASGGPAIADPTIATLADELAGLLGGKGSGPRDLRAAARLIERNVGRCWLAWSFAIRALDGGPQAEDLAVGSDPGISCSDVVSAVGCARRRQASAEWWRAALEAAEDSLASRAIVAMCILWCTPTVLGRIWRLLEQRIDRMGSDEYETLLDFVDRMGVVSNRRRVTSSAFAKLSATSRSFRTLVVASMRGTQISRRAVLRAASTDDGAHDRRLARMILEDRIEQIAAGSAVGSALDDVVSLFPLAGDTLVLNYGRRRPALAEDVARRILDDPDLYPISLIHAADASLSSLAMRGPDVASIAARQKWSAG